MDRYDLFQNSLVHDFASELAPSDSLSMFSDPELFPTQSMRGFTHHSNTAGDLMIGTRPYHPPAQSQMNMIPGPSVGGSGLGLSGVTQPATGINPMQLHTPSLPGIDELELTNIRLDDSDVDEVMVSTAEVGVQKDENDTATLPFGADLSSLIHLPPQTLEEIVGLSSTADVQMDHDAAATPPATPAQMMRSTRELQNSHQHTSLHSRSMSVPPFEHRPVVPRPVQQQGHATPQPLPSRSLSLFDIQPPEADMSSLPTASLNSSFPASTASISDQLRAFGDSLRSLSDFYDLPFLDLHYYNTCASNGGMSPQHHDIIDSSATNELRTGLALDLAQTQTHGNGQLVEGVSGCAGLGSASASVSPAVGVNASGMQAPPGFGAYVSSPSRPVGCHQRNQSAVSPKELLLQRGSDNKRKRASWDGGAA
jgi:hypothetical protein